MLKNFMVILVLLFLTVTLYAVNPSSRPGIGAIPYYGGTTFRTWAPNAATVNVAGSFNGWNIYTNPLADEGGGWWSADITSANIFDQYKYVINGGLWKIDPRARDVVHSAGYGDGICGRTGAATAGR